MPIELPPVRYAKSDDVHIAYQVVGDGSFDIVFVAGFVTHLGVLWSTRGTGDSWSASRPLHE